MKHSNSHLIASIVILSLALLIAAVDAVAYEANISWQHPTTRTDGAPMAVDEIKETKIRWECQLGEMGSILVPAPANQAVVTIDKIGTCTFYASTIDISGMTSAEVPAELLVEADAPPSPPTWLELLLGWIKRIMEWFV